MRIGAPQLGHQIAVELLDGLACGLEFGRTRFSTVCRRGTLELVELSLEHVLLLVAHVEPELNEPRLLSQARRLGLGAAC